MNLTEVEGGSYIRADDPGEHYTGEPRVSVTPDEADFLAFLAAGKTVCEVGTGLGVSTDALARNALHVVTIDVDPWVQDHVFPRYNGNSKVHTRALRPDAQFQMIFVDGDHQPAAVEADLRWALDHCDRGVIVFHDTAADHVRITLETLWAGEWAFIPTHHGLGVLWTGWA